MSKEEIVVKKELTYFEIIKVGPEMDFYNDKKRLRALASSFGHHIKFYKGPPLESDNFYNQLQDVIKTYEDLVAIEVSPELEEVQVRKIIDYSLGTLVMQPQFSGSIFIRYVSFKYPRLVINPIDLQSGSL